MRTNSYKYREWKKRQNEKELKRRTKRKKKKRIQRNRQIQFDRELRERPEYNSRINAVEFKAPDLFSIVDNPAGTISFFNKIIAFMIKKTTVNRLFIDIKDVSCLRIDALMYLLAIMNNHNRKYKIAQFSGNVPTDEVVKKKFFESGFYNYVHHRGNAQLNKSTDNIQIVSGRGCDPDIAKRVSDFVCRIADVRRSKCSFLYNTIVELMSNTLKHAYNGRSVLLPVWYYFVEYESNGVVSFTFMDTGLGIPSTVRKNFAERLDILGLKEDNKYVISALNGEFRTATKQGYRGKGLPQIRKYLTKDCVVDFHIVSNKAHVKVLHSKYDGDDLREAMQGTLYYWSVDLNKLKGE